MNIQQEHFIQGGEGGSVSIKRAISTEGKLFVDEMNTGQQGILT